MQNSKTWDNLTNTKTKQSTSYNFLGNKTAVSYLQSHQLASSTGLRPGETHIYLTVAIFDGEFAVLRNCHQTGKLAKGDLFFEQVVKMRTHYPIIKCWINYQIITHSGEQRLFGLLIDIYGSIYSIDFNQHSQNMKKFGLVQPLKYYVQYESKPFDCLNSAQRLFLELPLLIYKNDSNVVTFSLKGQLKIFDFNQNKSINQFTYEPVSYYFQNTGLAACNNTSKTSLKNVIVLCINNKKVPYIFVNCMIEQDFKRKHELQKKYYQEWEQYTKQITYCSFDSQTNMIGVSLISQEIQLFQIKENKEMNFHYCQRVMRFYISPTKVQLNIEDTVEHMHAARGFLLIVSCKQFILVDLINRKIPKRGKSKEMSMIKWTQIIDHMDNLLGIVLVKGYNHYNSLQCRIGNPNIHFKTIQIQAAKKAR